MICGLLMIAGCKPDAEEQVQTPTLEITTGDITADPAGQDCSITYTLNNKVENGRIAAECPADWITDIDYSVEGTVTFTVMPNDTDSERTASLSVSYAYAEGEELSDEVTIIQPVALPQYDYDFQAKLLTGVYYGTKYGQNGEYSYYVTFSDMPFAEDGYGQIGGTYYIFDMFGPVPEDEENPMIPLGEYTLGESGATAEYTFTPDLSGAFTVGASGAMDEMYVIYAEATLEIGLDSDGNYVMTADITDTDGKTHHVEYTGDSGSWRNESLPPYGSIDSDVDLTAYDAAGDFVKASGQETMFVDLYFSDKMFDDNGNIEGPGYVLTVQGWVPYDMGGSVGAGDYVITSEQGANFNLQKGYFYNEIPDGTYLTYYDEDGYPSYALVSSGTMSLKNWSGYYEISWNFTTEGGHAVTGSYAGELKVDMPKEFSSLEGDKTLDLSGAVASGTYYGDWYLNDGGNWNLKIQPPYGSTEGDGIQIDLVAERLGFEAGIPSGTYTASADGYPYPAYPAIGEYRRGFLDFGLLSGTGYMSAFNSIGQPGELAPATEGDLIITANEDGSYTIEFSFLDDKGHTWDGEWTGFIELSKYAFAGDVPAPRQ